MVVSRRSQTREVEERQDDAPPTAAAAGSDSTPSDSAKKNKKPNNKSPSTSSAGKRNKRKEHEQALRLKSTGLGLSISVDNDTKLANRKTVFNLDVVDDDDKDMVMDDTTLSDVSKAATDSKDKPITRASDDVSDDDDDAVEEVQQAAAREEIETQRLKERSSAAAIVAKQSKRRKRKSDDKETPISSGPDAMMESDFFEELDAELAQERKTRKLGSKQTDSEPKGKHTKFVVNHDDAGTSSVRVNDSIQLVVFDQDEEMATSLRATRAVSKQALIYSRSCLMDGKDRLSDKKRQIAKKSGRKNSESEGWVRSSKMNRLLVPGRSSLRKSGNGSVAPRFVVQGNT